MDSQNYKSGADRVAAINADIQRTGGLGGGAITASGMISQDGFTPIARNTPVTPTIQAGSLDTPTTPLQMPNIPPSTSAEGLSAMALAQGEQVKLQQEAEQKVAETQAQVDTSKAGFADTMNKILGVQNSQGDLENQYKLPEKNIALTDATNKLEASQRAQTNELRALEGQGLTDVQRAASSREINRKYAFEQADLALIQSAANRDLATAQSIVDRKIDLQMEPLKTKLDFAKFIYEQDREDNTAAQNKALDLKIKQFERQYETEKDNKQAVANIQLEAIKNGVTLPQGVLSELNNAKDANEAASILLKNNISLQNPLDAAYKQSQIDKVYLDAQTTQQDQGIVPGQKPMGKADYQSAAYATRTVNADKKINEVASQFVGSNSILGKFAPNPLKSSDRQLYEQAQRNFVNAVLRKESGAAISPEEFVSAQQQYFPQPGDGEDVIAQKSVNRIDAMNGLIGSSGKAYNGTYIAYPQPTQSSNPFQQTIVSSPIFQNGLFNIPK